MAIGGANRRLISCAPVYLNYTKTVNVTKLGVRSCLILAEEINVDQTFAEKDKKKRCRT